MTTDVLAREKTLIHVTHIDLDAAGCDVIFRKAHGEATHFYPTTHDVVDKHIQQILNRELGISPDTVAGPNTGQARENIADVRARAGKIVLWVTDIAPSRETLNILQDLQQQFQLFDDLFVCDHHKTSTHLGESAYSFVRWGDNQCGALLAYNYATAHRLVHRLATNAEEIEEVASFVEAVDAYDTWKLDSPSRKRGEELDRLFKVYGVKNMAQEFARDPSFDLRDSTQNLLSALRDKEADFIESRLEALKRAGPPILTDRDGNQLTYCVDSSHENTSVLGHAMLNAFPQADYVVIMHLNGTFSLRSRDGGVDVGQIAKRHGGGGHAGAAGFKLDTTLLQQFLLQTVLL